MLSNGIEISTNRTNIYRYFLSFRIIKIASSKVNSFLKNIFSRVITKELSPI